MTSVLLGSGGVIGRSGFLGFGGGLLGRSATWGLRFAFGGGFDELFLADRSGLRSGGLAFEHGIGCGAGVQLHGADGVVVARDRVIDQFRIVVGVDDRDHRDAELAGFLDGDVFVADV